MFQIERAWVDDQDDTVVDRLVLEYPQYRELLCEFFDFLMLGEYELPPSVSEEEITRLIHSIDVPDNWVQLLRQETGKKLGDIAKELSNTSVDYMQMVNRLPELVPSAVKENLASEMEQRFGLAAWQTRRYLSSNPEIPLAACRDDAFPEPPKTFEELLARSGLTKKEQRYWLKIAEGGTTQNDQDSAKSARRKKTPRGDQP